VGSADPTDLHGPRLALKAAGRAPHPSATRVRGRALRKRRAAHAAVTTLFRLPMIEAERSPEVARALDEGRRKTTREAVAVYLGRAAARGLIGDADPDTMAAQCLALPEEIC
jgi:hypothetical protein